MKKLSLVSARITEDQRSFLESVASRLSLPTDSGLVVSRAVQAIVSWAMSNRDLLTGSGQCLPGLHGGLGGAL
jgi:hypothetical protein